MSLLSAIFSWRKRRADAKYKKRFQEGWDWASGEWQNRNQRWTHPQFTQIDRDCYAIALIWQFIDTSAVFGGMDAFDKGAAAFARQLKTSSDPQLHTALRLTDRPFFS